MIMIITATVIESISITFFISNNNNFDLKPYSVKKNYAKSLFIYPIKTFYYIINKIKLMD